MSKTHICKSCGGRFPKSEIVYLGLKDTQGYHAPGHYCLKCSKSVRYEAFQVEDEDSYMFTDQDLE